MRLRGGDVSERTALLRDPESASYSTEYNRFHTPVDSPVGSDSDTDETTYHHAHSRLHSHVRSSSCSSLNSILGTRDQEYVQKAHETMDALWDMMKNQEGWAIEKEKPGVGVIKSRPSKISRGKGYKLEAIVNISPIKLWEDTITDLPNQPNWNPTLLEARTLQVLDDTTEISYTIANEAAGGIVSARDFINVRHWDEREGVYLIALNGVKYDDMPEQKKYVR
ncbi:hypothetical protein FSP39_016222 [Pinctada imbricata]|uniref:START domain-containing protein n=1 Tax=Pinctada imbricata TaxID=66713 RepID=A0AA88YJ87_PINIB|nr:hypothetical protein FSP39_016222 [Pinctada imbricata]